MVVLRLNEWLKELFSITRISLFHSICKICNQILVHRDEEIVCRTCIQEINAFLKPVCQKCGKAIEGDGLWCGDCMLNPPAYQKHVSYSLYQGVLKELILLFKYYEIKKLKYILAGYYIDLLKQKLNERFDCIIPVPSDLSRKRDFDPNQVIAKILSKELNIRVLKNSLIKVKKTAPQVALPLKKRLKNLDGAFKVNKSPMLIGKKILLIDDVYTTGTTINKCTQVLQRNKNRVFAITLARSK